MRTRNCYCGIVAHANCTRCGQGVCSTHHRDSDHTGAWFYRNYGQGKTLAEAAYVRGYWSAPRDRFICKGCRGQNGRQHSQGVLAQSRKWKQQDPFGFALAAASRGYVITEPGISYAGVVQSWLGLNWQPVEDISIQRLTREAKLRGPRHNQRVVRPAEYAIDRFRGWSFPRTVGVRSQNMRTDAEEWSWSGRTDILTDGRVLHMGQPATTPLEGVAYRLIVEIGRKMFTSRGHEWKGPQENWDT